MAEEFENSFKDNAVEAVDDIEERNDWREDDTSYDEDQQSMPGSSALPNKK